MLFVTLRRFLYLIGSTFRRFGVKRGGLGVGYFGIANEISITFGVSGIVIFGTASGVGSDIAFASI